MVKEGLETEITLLSKLTEIHDKQSSSEIKIDEIQTRVSAIENRLLSLHETQGSIDKLKERVSKSYHDVQYLCKQAENLGSLSWKNKLIVRGIKEEGLESDEMLFRKANETDANIPTFSCSKSLMEMLKASK